MTNIFNFEKSIKMKWLKIAITDICKHWLSLLLQDIDLKKLASVGSEYCESLLYKLNPFWKAVFMYYKDYVQHLTFKTPEDILTSSIWYNTKFGTEKIFFFDWYKNGIHIIGDIIDPEGKLMTFEQIRAKYKFPLNILNYYTVKKIVQKFVTKTELNLAKYFRRPYIPFHINALIGHYTGSKSIYLRLQESCIPKIKSIAKWESILHTEPSYSFWRVIYKNCFYSVDDNNYIWFQYRVLQRIIGVQEWLFKTKVSDNSDCRLCNEHTESIAHLFSECKTSNDLWENVASWIKAQTKETVIITKNMKILGCLEPLPCFWPLNFILLITRYYIFTRARLLGDLNIYHLQQIMKNRYLEQECLSKLNSTDKEFTKKWSAWKILFQEI